MNQSSPIISSHNTLYHSNKAVWNLKYERSVKNIHGYKTLNVPSPPPLKVDRKSEYGIWNRTYNLQSSIWSSDVKTQTQSFHWHLKLGYSLLLLCRSGSSGSLYGPMDTVVTAVSVLLGDSQSLDSPLDLLSHPRLTTTGRGWKARVSKWFPLKPGDGWLITGQ